jgi:polar amino acid transport system substrate-binding protein
MPCTGSIAAIFGALTLVSGEPTVIGTTGDFPPFTHLRADGMVEGLDPDIGNELCRRLALTCTWEVTEFDQLIPGLMAGEYDFVMGGMASSEERAQLVDFTRDYQTSEGDDDFVGRPGAPPPDSAMIGVQSGTIHERHLAKTGRQYQTYPTQTATIAALTNGQVDLIFGSFSATMTSQQLLDAGFEYLYFEPAGADGPAIAVCKGNTGLLTRLDAALQDMLADGTIDEFHARWQ